MAEILFFEIYFVLIMILSIVMFFIMKKDIWFQFIWIGTFIIHFIFLLFAIHDFNNLQMGNAILFERVYLDKINLNSNNVSNEVINSPDDYHVFNFANLNELYDSQIVDVDFCFRYNNSDGSNVLHVVNNVAIISDNIYILNNSVGSVCANIKNVSLVDSHANIGYHCEDCSIGNTFNFIVDNTGTSVLEVEIDKANPYNYFLDYGKPHIAWLEIRYLPVKSINDLFFTYLWVLGSLFLIFACYTIIKIMKGETEEVFK